MSILEKNEINHLKELSDRQEAILNKLYDIYILNVDEEGEPKTKISEIIKTWESAREIRRPYKNDKNW